MAAEKPRLLYAVKLRRGPYRRRFFLLVIALIAAAGAYFALDTAARGEVANGTIDLSALDPLLLDVGRVIAGLIVGVLILRLGIVVYRLLTLRDETIRVFDKGIAYERGGRRKPLRRKFSWKQLKSYRAGARTMALFGRAVLHRGANELTMTDGTRIRVDGRHGDPRRFHKVMRPIVADVSGRRISAAIRSGKQTRLHRALSVGPEGIGTGRQHIPWEEADVRLKDGTLLIRRLNDKGRFKTMRRYDARRVENLSGFLDVAESVIQNYQPERFNIQTRI
ncbi:MAG: hypothetical protein ACOCYT_01920 [Chloroflexota bacterium]